MGKGSGLGLSMVDGFARQCGGRAALKSEIGRGTTVSLYLPPMGRGAAPHEAGRNPVVTFGSESVLLVEDDPAVRRTIRLMLEDFGYKVAEAGDGQGAMEMMRKGMKVDLVCTDLVMPGRINGWQLALDIWQRAPAQKILFCTGYSDSPLIGLMGEDRRVHILHKPFGRKDLAAAVRETLDDGPGAKAPNGIGTEGTAADAATREVEAG
jgi:CheY-like chemotaxis protein